MYDQYTYWQGNLSLTNIDTINILYTIEGTADAGANIIFNCFYSIFVLFSFDTYVNLFTGGEILFNVLFGVGTIYTDISTYLNLDIFNYTYTRDYYREVGKLWGDAFCRLGYRQPLNTTLKGQPL